VFIIINCTLNAVTAPETQNWAQCIAWQ